MQAGGRQYYGKQKSSQFFIEQFCDFCKTSCYKHFRGTIVIQCTINTAIKANRTSYQDQDIDLLVKNAFEVTRRVSQYADIKFVHPQMPTAKLFINCELQKKAFTELLWSLSKYDNIGFDSSMAKNNKWHGKDGYHLERKANTSFWSKIKDDLAHL